MIGWGIGVGALVGSVVAAWRLGRIGSAAERRARDEVARARTAAEATRAQGRESARRALAERRQAVGREFAQMRARLADEERRLAAREVEASSWSDFLAAREKAGGEEQSEVNRLRGALDRHRAEARDLRRQVREGLLAKAGWTLEEATAAYQERLAQEVRLEADRRIQRRLALLEEQAEDEAKRVVEIVIQRVRPDYTEDHPQSAYTAEDMGKAAAFLKPDSPLFSAFEEATGVRLDWREGEGVVILSCPNGVRREIARRTLRKFAGMKEPRVEALPRLAAEATRDAEAEMRRTINWVLGRLRIGGVHPEIVKTLGRLKYRTSHAQNVLSHSYEVGFIGSMLSSELGLNPKTGKRGAFMHDLGKALDAEKDAGHAVIGGDFAAQHGEDETIVNAIAAHHEDVERKSLYPIVAQVADAISGGRPGARRETTERFLERVDQLMAIGASLPGVSGYYAVHAGREFRVVVNPHQVKDEQLPEICKTIASRIEQSVGGPGVEIIVSRETRVVDYAR